mmetsp:Transcript_21789/g.32113  ORF Transcript_21789/g.32113 Transcript_21789/m.32113 type:complete len:275 (-) Transcript_21789:1416-2240(-)
MCIHNTNVHSRIQDRMMQEHRVDRLANLGHSTESKRQVRNSSRNLHIRTLLLNGLHSIDEVHSVVGMLLHTGSNSQHIGIKNNILWWKLDLIHQNVIRTLANAHLLICGGGLTILIEGHTDYGSSMLLQQSRLLLEKFLSNLQRNRVDNGLTLAPLQTCHDNLKLRGIKHKWHLAHIRLGHSDLHKLLHGSNSIQQTIIDIDINHMSSILDLLLCNVHGSGVVTCHHQLLEADRSRNITTLSYIQERHTQVIVHIIYDQVLEPRQPHLRTSDIW